MTGIIYKLLDNLQRKKGNMSITVILFFSPSVFLYRSHISKTTKRLLFFFFFFFCFFWKKNNNFVLLSPSLKQCLNFHWLVACFVFNSSLREYFSLHRAVSHRQEENMRYGRRARTKSQPTPAPIKSIIGHCPTIIHISRTPGTEVSQHRRPTRQPHTFYWCSVEFKIIELSRTNLQN